MDNQEVYFSHRAYISILKETQARISTETGGIFLGRVEGNKWYIIEALDPGPNSVFLTTYFEYDRKYLEHLISKINYLYASPLKIMGLWHRHPGSFNVFSSTDDGTNYKFAKLNREGAISALVNIEPRLMLTVYHVEAARNVAYTNVGYKVGDEYIPKEYLEYASVNNAERDISDYSNRKYLSLIGRNAPKIDIKSVTEKVLCEAEPIIADQQFKQESQALLNEVNLDKILELLEVDLTFFNDSLLKYKLRKVDSLLELNFIDAQIKIQFGYITLKDMMYFEINMKKYRYRIGLFAECAEKTEKKLLKKKELLLNG